MIKPYGPSQPPTPGCGIQTLPAFCHKERFLSYKKRGERGGGWGVGWCTQVFNNKCSDLPPGSHPNSLCQAGGKACGRENREFPLSHPQFPLIVREVRGVGSGAHPEL